VVARNIGDFTGEPIIEVEEMVVATPDFSFQDYLDTRVFHLLLTIFYYEGNYEEPFAYAQQHGVKAFDLVVRMQQLLAEAPPEFRKVIDDFLVETKQEIFLSRQACLDWAKAHYAELVDGTLGGNLLSKYSMIGRFVATQAGLDFLELATGRVLGERGVRFEAKELATIFEYLRAVVLHVPFAETLPKRVQWKTEYDVEAWIAERYAKPLADHRFDAPRTYFAEAAPDKRALIETKLATFGEHPSGLGKFTRTMFARDLRRSFTPARPRLEGAKA
ncbi:MAG: hypothetical protein IT453_18410, partial [Planctomycetes bacterium]|nr:hypothetical protein [Planctomycetota bacterium]